MIALNKEKKKYMYLRQEACAKTLRFSVDFFFNAQALLYSFHKVTFTPHWSLEA